MADPILGFGGPSTKGPQPDAHRTPAEGGNTRDDDLLTMFDRWTPGMSARWSAWREDAKMAYDFAAGHQWSPEDRGAMETDNKIPVVFNLTAPTLDAVAGAEIQNRQQAQYFPREPGDQGMADALTDAAQYVQDDCNGDQEDSEAFYDTLVCGVGWTESRPEVEEATVTLVKERIDPLQMMADPSSRKPNFEDARYLCREIPMSQDEFDDFREELERPDLEVEGQALGDLKRITVVDPRQRYTHGMLGDPPSSDEVILKEWQWWEREPLFIVPLPHPQDASVTHLAKLTAEQFEQAIEIRPELANQHSRSFRRVYYRAFVGAGEVLFSERLKEGKFRYQAITGKRDRNAGTWFGLVRAMIDPQRFTNKLYTEILHIVRTNANGGLAMEEDAVSDIRSFEQTWAQSDRITWLKPGALSGPNGAKMVPKTPPPVNMTMFQLMDFAKQMVRACTGVNEEILGLVGREQPGVLEAQRKQAAYGILSQFFDAKRRYQRDQGKLQLAQMQLYMSPDTLVRIVEGGTAKYVPLAMTMTATDYDIRVDEAPAGPNAKARTMAVLGPLLPQFLEGGLIGPEEIADSLQYLDIPASVAEKLATAIRAHAAKPNPAAQAAEQAQLENKQADTENKRASAAKSAATAAKTASETEAQGQENRVTGAVIDALAPEEAMDDTGGGDTAVPDAMAQGWTDQTAGGLA